MAKKEHEYIVRAVMRDGAIIEGEYAVLKFDPLTLADGGQPINTYTVKYNPPRQMGRCNCPAGEYRGTGANDKHVKIVRQWIEGGQQSTVVA